MKSFKLNQFTFCRTSTNAKIVLADPVLNDVSSFWQGESENPFGHERVRSEMSSEFRKNESSDPYTVSIQQSHRSKPGKDIALFLIL